MPDRGDDPPQIRGAMGRSTTVTVIAVLALAQGVLGVLRAFQWFKFGSDLSHAGILLLPILGTVAIARGVFVAVIAMLYIVFALGALAGKGWARSVGILTVVFNLLVVVTLMIAGESLAGSLFWAIVPLILAAYLVGQSRREALGR
jgi:hypothetical protein